MEPQAGSAAAEGEGILRVTLGNGARTVLPDTAGLYYVLTLTPQGGGEAVTADITGEAPVERSLKTGRWDLEVKGYISQAVCQADPAAYGLRGTAANIEVKAGETSPVSVALTATDQGDGDLVFDFSFPVEVTDAELSFVKLMKGEDDSDPAPIDLLDPGYLTKESTAQSRGRVTIPSGYYRVRVGLAPP